MAVSNWSVGRNRAIAAKRVLPSREEVSHDYRAGIASHCGSGGSRERATDAAAESLLDCPDRVCRDEPGAIGLQQLVPNGVALGAHRLEALRCAAELAGAGGKSGRTRSNPHVVSVASVGR